MRQTVQFHFYDGPARLTNTTLFNCTNAALNYIGRSDAALLSGKSQFCHPRQLQTVRLLPVNRGGG